MGLADFDNDGDVEIFMGNRLLDHEGNQLFQAANEPLNFITRAQLQTSMMTATSS